MGTPFLLALGAPQVYVSRRQQHTSRLCLWQVCTYLTCHIYADYFSSSFVRIYAVLLDTTNCVIWQLALSTGNVSVVAGTGVSTDDRFESGTGIPATTTAIASPTAVACDMGGYNVYFIVGHNQILKLMVSPGLIYLVAGVGGPGNYGGDDGAAQDAFFADARGIMLNYPSLFIAGKLPASRVLVHVCERIPFNPIYVVVTANRHGQLPHSSHQHEHQRYFDFYRHGSLRFCWRWTPFTRNTLGPSFEYIDDACGCNVHF